MNSAFGVTVNVAFHDGDAVVAVTGELDVASCGALRERLNALVEGHQVPRCLVVDTSGVDFIDACGIGVLVAARRHAEERGVPLRISLPSRALRRVLAILGEALQLPVDSC